MNYYYKRIINTAIILMNKEIDLMVNYPRAKRNIEDRGNTKTEQDREIARRFDKDF